MTRRLSPSVMLGALAGLAVALLAMSACTPQPGTVQQDSVPAPQRPVTGDTSGRTTGAVTAPVGSKAAVVTVSDVAAGRVATGTLVSTRGRCLADTALRAPGGPPRTRSDWQLADDVAAVFVTGPRPAGCEPRTGSAGEVAVSATVAQDSLPALSGPARPRWYLVAR